MIGEAILFLVPVAAIFVHQSQRLNIAQVSEVLGLVWNIDLALDFRI